MARVPVYGERKVGTAALPGARRRNAAESFESAGGEVAQAQAGFGAVATKVSADLITRERDRADQVANLTILRKLNDLDHRILRDPDKGMLNKRGLAVMENRKAALEDFDKAAGEIGASVRNERQKLFFDQQLIARRDAVRNSIDTHGSRELERHQVNEAQATIATLINGAISNADEPARIAESLANAEQIVDVHGARMGLGDAGRAEMKGKIRSSVHAGVIERLLAADKDVAAKTYFEETKDQIAGEQLARIEKALEEGTLRGQAQTSADTIVGAGGTLSEQREKVRAIDDPKLRDEVMRRVEHEAVIRDRADREQLEADLNTAYDLVDQRQSVTAIPPALWTKLPGSARESLRSYATKLAKGEPVETHLPTYYALMRQAGEDPVTFANQPLLDYRGKLDEPEFKQLAALQLSLRNGDRKQADAALDGFRTNQQIVDDTLREVGILTGDSKEAREAGDVERVARFRRILDQRVTALQENTGKKATNADVQAIADSLLQSVTLEKPAWWQVWKGDTTKRVVDVTAADIPAADRQQIEAALKAQRRAVTDDAVLNLYLSTQRRLGALK
jgi:hypothetical protein